MAAKRTPAKAAAKDAAAPKPARKPRKERKFPALTFEEALALPEAIQKYASGRYGLTKGSYTAEHLELTPEGNEATSDDVAPAKKLEARFNLAIKNHAPFDFLYQKLQGGKMPVKEVMADYLSEASVEDSEKAECIDKFVLNAKFLGLLRTIAGSERIIPLEQALEEAPTVPARQADQSAGGDSGAAPPFVPPTSTSGGAELTGEFAKICFYITPIGEEISEERRHADFLMEYIIKPAVKEFDLAVIRADQMGKPGMIGKQVIEHILKARLVIADLSFHNPNVFYELCLRHATRLPTVQVIRAVDKIPFDLNQYRTIPIETQNAYTLYPKLQTYTAQIANQVRRALEDSESGDNPISLYYPSAKLTWGDK